MKNVSTTAPDEVADLMIERAAGIHVSKGAFLRLLLQDWYDRGAPAVSPLDRLMVESNPKAEKAVKKAVKNAQKKLSE